MIYFACDWCNAVKKTGETWVLGMAAESVGLTAARREINVLSGWDETQACHPLAVHFCCVDHKDRYMAALFESHEPAAETVVETTVSTGSNRKVARKLMRTTSTKPRAKTKARAKRKRAA